MDNIPADAVRVETVEAAGRVEPRGGNNDALPPTQIGPRKPLSLRIRSMYPGDEAHDAVLVMSAVKNPSQTEAGPRAVHYVFEDAPGMRPLKPTADQDGSDVVFYTPAALDDALDVLIRFAYDDFDAAKYKRWLDAASKSADLPVFAVATTLGGAGGAAAGKAALYLVENAVRVVLGAFDRDIDGNNDWISTWTLNISRAGLRSAEPGWVLFYGDDPEAQFAPGADGFYTQTLQLRGRACAVDTRQGLLVYADAPDEPVTGEPYVLAYLNGAEEEQLNSWRTAAVTAELAERFLNVTGDPVSDIGELLTVYNDAVFAKKIGAVSRRIDKATGDDKQRLTKERDALLKHIQDDKFKDLLAL